MINPTSITPLMEEHHICRQAIIHLLNEGVALERLRLEVQELTKSDTLDSYVKIMQGERFLTLLITSGSK